MTTGYVINTEEMTRLQVLAESDTLLSAHMPSGRTERLKKSSAEAGSDKGGARMSPRSSDISSTARRCPDRRSLGYRVNGTVTATAKDDIKC